MANKMDNKVCVVASSSRHTDFVSNVRASLCIKVDEKIDTIADIMVNLRIDDKVDVGKETPKKRSGRPKTGVCRGKECKLPYNENKDKFATRSLCTNCQRKYASEYREKNREKIRSYDRNYYHTVLKQTN